MLLEEEGEEAAIHHIREQIIRMISKPKVRAKVIGAHIEEEEKILGIRTNHKVKILGDNLEAEDLEAIEEIFSLKIMAIKDMDKILIR